MAGKPLNITGHVYGNLTVKEFVGTNKWNAAMWKCLCLCEKEIIVESWRLRRGDKKNCGCVNSEIIRRRHVQHGHTKGGRWTTEYSTWKNMIRRCSCPDDRAWKYYGARGITVCARWDSFENFYTDMGPRPEERSLDRINVNGNYEPGNCRWATKKEQVLNRRQIYRTKRECLNITLNALEQVASWIIPDDVEDQQKYIQQIAREAINISLVIDTTRRRIDEVRQRRIPSHRSPTQNQIVRLVSNGITTVSGMLQNSSMEATQLSSALGRMKKYGKIISLGNAEYALPKQRAVVTNIGGVE